MPTTEKFVIGWRTFVRAIDVRVFNEDQDQAKAFLEVLNIFKSENGPAIFKEVQASNSALTGPKKHPGRYLSQEEEDAFKELYPNQFDNFINCKLKAELRVALLKAVRSSIKFNNIMKQISEESNV